MPNRGAEAKLIFTRGLARGVRKAAVVLQRRKITRRATSNFWFWPGFEQNGVGLVDPVKAVPISVAGCEPRADRPRRIQASCTVGPSILGLPYWTCNQTIRGHPRRVPGFHGRPANRAFEAADLSARNHGFGTVVNRPAGARSMLRFRHVCLCACSSAIAIIKVARCLLPTNDASAANIASHARDNPVHEKINQGHRQRSNDEIPGSSSIAGFDCSMGRNATG